MNPTAWFWLALGIVIGLLAGVFSVAATAQWERNLLKQRYWQRGYDARCVEEPIRQLRLVKSRRSET